MEFVASGPKLIFTTCHHGKVKKGLGYLPPNALFVATKFKLLFSNGIGSRISEAKG